MAGVLRNLRVVLGVDFNEDGLKKADRALAAIDKRLGAVGRRAMLAGGLGGLAGSATALTAALAPAAAAVGALPGAMAAAKTATATLKVGLIGVSEAMGTVAEGDAAALDEALTKLSPQARKFVKATAGLKQAFDPIQQAVQDRLFEGLSKQMGPVASNLLPSIEAGMSGVADGFNAGAKEALRFAATPMAKGTVNKVFASSSRIMSQLSGAVQPALKGISALTVAGLPLAERMAKWATNGIKSAGAFASSAEGAAKMRAAIDRAGDTLAQLGRIGGNIGRGLAGVFGQMESSGDGVLDTIEKLTAKFAAWSRSAEGQQQAAETFRLLRDVVSDIGDVLPLVMGPLGAIAKILTSLPEPLGDVVTQMLAFGVIVGPLAGKLGALTSAGLHAAQAVGQMRESAAAAGGPVGALGTAASKTRTALGTAAGVLAGPWGIALAAGATALALFAGRNDEADQRIDDLTDALVRNKGALDDTTAASIRNRLENDGVLRAAQQLKLNLADVSAAALGNRAAMDRVNAGMAEAEQRVLALDNGFGQVEAAKEFVSLTSRVRSVLEGTNGELKEARDRYGRLAAATPATTSAAEKVEESFLDVGTSASGASTKIDTLNARLAKFHSLTADADMAAMGFEEQIEGLSKAIGKNEFGFRRRNGVLDLTNKRTRESNRLVIDAIRSAVDHAEKLRAEGRGSDVANAALKRHIDRLRGVMEKSGMSKREIDKLVRRYVTMPGQINAATNKIKDKNVRILIKANGSVVGYKIPGMQQASASGGILRGWSPGKDIHTFYSPTGGTLALSGGEAVMRPEWTRAIGPAAVDQMNAAARRGGVDGVKRLLSGGVGPKHLRGEGAFFADGGIIARNSITGMANVKKAIAFADRLYGTLAGRIGTDVAKKISSSLGGPGAQRGLAWARMQAGKPYVWGGVGPRGYDCSGLWSALVNVIKGRPAHSRLFTTWSFGSSGGPGGFVRNRRSAVRVGVTDAGVGHMAGTIGRTNIESRGSRGVVVGSAARGADNSLFTRRYGMKFDSGGVLPPGHTPVYNGTRKPEYVFTQRQMQQGIGGPTKVEITVNVPATADKAAVGKAVYESLQEYKRRSFGNRSMGL